MSWPGLKGKRTLPGGVAARVGESGLSVLYWSTDGKDPERGAVVRPHGVESWTVESRQGGRLVGFLSYPDPGRAQDEAERFVAGGRLDVRARRGARPAPAAEAAAGGDAVRVGLAAGAGALRPDPRQPGVGNHPAESRSRTALAGGAVLRRPETARGPGADGRGGARRRPGVRLERGTARGGQEIPDQVMRRVRQSPGPDRGATAAGIPPESRYLTLRLFVPGHQRPSTETALSRIGPKPGL